VVVLDHPKNVLVASAGPAVKRMEEIRPVEILATPAGETVFDMGQNMVGRVRIRVEGPAGTTLTLRHAEVLDGEGNIYTENLRAATQSVTYTLRGGGPETYEPHFTFQGFRYVAVDGWPGTPTPDDLTGIVIHSDMPVTGHFETSDSLLNQLQHNIIWGQKGTSGSAGPAMRRCSRARQPSTWTSPPSSQSGLRIWPPIRRRAAAFRTWCRMC
jgi:alpha-L-rhamnosidase